MRACTEGKSARRRCHWFPKGTLLRSWLTKSRPRLLLLIAGLKRPQVTLMRRKRMKRTKVAKATETKKIFDVKNPTFLLFVAEPAAGCPTSPESLTERICSLDMEDKQKQDQRVGSFPQRRTKTQQPQNPVKPEDEPQRLRPPD
ncbi:hypothetical protein PFLUV_G00000980 [Scomber scombrus]|uniref:Uncharacterized protein n=1 Tax=Scomber scombrus TaxID=13677 RepID=A0AAV1QEH9_SCOSC